MLDLVFYFVKLPYDYTLHFIHSFTQLTMAWISNVNRKQAKFLFSVIYCH